LLAQNLPNAEVHHERIGFDAFGVDVPDLSHMTLFNSRGNIRKVRRFWDQKLDRILKGHTEFYAETSHVLMKAGLVENAVRRCKGHDLHFVRLHRAKVPTLLSYERRGDFLNKSSQWLWYLDHDYPRTFINADAFRQFGFHGLSLWYMVEIEFRAVYYQERYKHSQGVYFHETDIDELNKSANAEELLSSIYPEFPPNSVRIPKKTNASKEVRSPDPEYLQRLEKLVAGTKSLDPYASAREFLREKVDIFAPDELPE
jgi:hypothetical protein